MKNFLQKSLKKNLIITLSSLVALTLILIYSISFFATKKQIQEVFDANLVKSAKLIYGITENEIFIKKDFRNFQKFDFKLDFEASAQQKTFHRYEHKMHSQIWAGENLIYNSSKDHLVSKPDYNGFRDISVDKKDWRSFAFFDEKSGLTILVLEQKNIRNKLINEIVFSLFLPLLLSFIPLFIIILATVDNGLRPLNFLAQKIKNMSTKTLAQYHDPNIPIELKPFFNSFNSLISRLSDSMASERRFTDYAAHELKTPLAAITLQAQLLQKNKNSEKGQEYLQDLINGINRMTHLVNQILTLARIEPEQKNIAKENFDLINLAKILLEAYQNHIADKSLEIEIISELKTQEMNIFANKFYIEILLSNLIDNAIKYSDCNQKIILNFWQKNEISKFKISNFGAQISTDAKEKIFDNFYRANNAATLNKKSYIEGCGLGLAIAKKIVDLHGGEICFESKQNLNWVEVSF
ncbi:MAG: HAMP domain-containing sensor histidine kinase [Rickettsiales bacterium]|nr:HAMP domain-containing sensor histidine kinase [Rickettsiales bacterium]